MTKFKLFIKIKKGVQKTIYCSSFDFQNGTCYTKDECEEKSGTSAGTCAEGYGVCCTCKLDT